MKTLRDPVRRKESLTCGGGKWFYHDGAFVYSSLLIPSISLNLGRRLSQVSVLASLASVDFFPRLNYVLKGRRFESGDERKFTGRAVQYFKWGIPGSRRNAGSDV
jgi:hypothetical protein